MEPIGDRLLRIWNELRRRRVVGVAIVYGAGAWVLVEVADVVLPNFLQQPEMVLRLLIIGVLIGFPVAMVLAWVFDITPGGLVRTDEGPRPPPSARSIAVLPFENLSRGEDGDYFSDGLSEEILNSLSKVKGLRVAARSSAFAFKGRREDIHSIGERLNVATVLDGSVRRQGERVRVSAQLADVSDGFTLWSNTYERRLDDIFEIQAEISESIIDAFKCAVLAAAQPAPEPPATGSFEAYNLYLLGRHHFHRRTQASLYAAIRYFEQAIETDANYALAYAGLADSYSLLSSELYGNLAPEASIAQAQPAVSMALGLAPDLAEAHAAAGLLMHNEGDFAGAEAPLQRAMELDPNYTMAYVWYGLVLSRQMRFREAMEIDEKVYQLDPLSPIINTNLGYDLLRVGRHADALRRFETVLELDPGFVIPYSGIAQLHYSRGALDQALVWRKRALERAPDRSEYRAKRGFLHLLLGDHEQAQLWIDSALELTPDDPIALERKLALLLARAEPDVPADSLQSALLRQPASPNVAAVCAQVSLMQGQVAEARRLYEEQVQPQLDDFIRRSMTGQWALPHAVNLAQARMRTGDEEGRAALLEYLASLEALRADGVASPELRYGVASILVLLEQSDKALAMLRAAVEAGWRNALWARHDPNLQRLRKHPEFTALLEEVDARLADL